MLARRYHDERCQNRLAAWSASDWVASRRSFVAAQAGTRAAVGQSARMSLRLKASVAGHIALDPNPSASRWYGDSASDVPSPEKTVRIVTVWPSSRRLAIRPPHESATSSGCGATKTWVMAGRVYRGRPGVRDAGGPRSPRVAAGADERDEDAGAIGHVGPLVPVPGHHGQHLALTRPDGDDEAGAVGQLVAQGGRDDGRGRRDQDPVPRGAIGPAEAAVCGDDLDRVAVPESLQPRPGRRGEVRMALDRRHAAAEVGEDRRLVAGARADLEDAVSGPGGQQLGHAGDHERLADGLAELDGEGLVVVGVARVGDVHEPLAWHLAHHPQDPLVP